MSLRDFILEASGERILETKGFSDYEKPVLEEIDLKLKEIKGFVNEIEDFKNNENNKEFKKLYKLFNGVKKFGDDYTNFQEQLSKTIGIVSKRYKEKPSSLIKEEILDPLKNIKRMISKMFKKYHGS